MPHPNRHTVTISKVVTGGLGLARLADGLVVLVPFVLPGETVVISLAKTKKGFAEGVLHEVLSTSPHRIAPPCPHFTECGGCHLQHADYAGQLAIKEAILLNLLERQGDFPAATIADACQPPLASPQPFHYRQRIRLQVDNLGRPGFFARRSHAVVPVVACLLADDTLNQVLAELNGLAAFAKLMAQAMSLELLLSPLAGRLEVIVHLKRKPRPADSQAAASIAKALPLVQGVWLTGEGFAMHGPYGTTPGNGAAQTGIAFALAAERGERELILRFEAGGFCQVNHRQNEGLIRQLLDWAEVKPTDAVLDLFCGMGNFSLPLALRARQVVGTDLQRSSIRGAEANALANQLTNCRFLRTDAAAAVDDCLRAGERFDLILLDPPRQGCRELIPMLPDLGAGKILYISCDPATLVRDLCLLKGFGYHLRKIRAVDMFPQTSHLESIALLTKN